jgi:hypothetical protein
MPHARAVHRVPRREVVAAVEHDIDTGNEIEKFFLLGPLLKGSNRNVGIEFRERCGGFVNLRAADALGSIQDLALQVGEVDLVGVGEGELAEAARGEVEGCRAAEAAGADDQRGRRPQPLLPLDPDLGKEDVAAVAEELLIVQFSWAWSSSPRPPAWYWRASAAGPLPARP